MALNGTEWHELSVALDHIDSCGLIRLKLEL